MMGVRADAVLEGGGEVLGGVPDCLTEGEVAHPDLTEMVVTSNMRDRKRRMADAADAFVTLPGGVGTLDETIEIVSSRQLRLHDKPIYICGIAAWATPVGTTIQSPIAPGF